MAGTIRLRVALIGVWSLVASPVCAQSTRLELRLAADPDRRGPPAWTQVREHALAAISRSFDAPLDALAITIDEELHVVVERDESPASSDGYVSFRLHVDGRELASGTCDQTGRESWIVEADAATEALPPPIRTLARRFAYEATTGWLSLDLSAAVGNLMAASAEGDVASEAMTLGAAECGGVAVMARRGDDGRWHVTGQSDGGLLLPAVLLALADLQSGRLGAAGKPPLAKDLERWLLLASSATCEEQQEAARQLGRFRDPRAVRALERLLLGKGIVREIAMHGLVRLGSSASLGAIVAAADPNYPGTVSLAASAVLSLTPRPVVEAIAGELKTRSGTTSTTVHDGAASAIRGLGIDTLFGAIFLVLAVASAIRLHRLQRGSTQKGAENLPTLASG